MVPDSQRATPAHDPDFRPINSVIVRWLLIAFGWVNVFLGVIGVIIPGLPTTVFLLVAAWAFSRSSEKFQRWLFSHPKLGPFLEDWRKHRVIPTKAKIIAGITMSLSLSYVLLFVATSWVLPTGMAVIMLPALIYIVTRTGTRPSDDETVP